MDTEEGKPSTQGTEAREALERFVVENDDLLTLESRIGRFNIFDALGITRVEIRHSNFLAFILDPAESHGQGQIFLKAVLMDLLKKASPGGRPLSPIDLDGTDLRGVEVRREWKHIDLLILCQEPRLCVVIENKIGSKEGPDQLSRYEATVKQHYPGVRPLYVYLTLDSEVPSEDAWMSYSHADIHRVLTRVRETNGNAIGDDVLVFLDHYLSLLGTRFMNDKEIDELCRKIYKNHRQALDLIWERVGTPESGVLADVANVLEEDPRWHMFYQRGKLTDFLPKAWLEWLPPHGVDFKDIPQAWIVLRFHLFEGSLDFYAEVRRMADPAMRRRIVELLIAEAPGFGFKRSQAGKLTDKYTRFCGREKVSEWGEDDKPESEAIRVAVKKTLDDLYPKLEKLALVLKPLCKGPASAT
jgi:hypothetical protein